jgi:hypothetical protein
VACLRVIDVEVDVDLLWVASGHLGGTWWGASWTPMLHIPSPSMTEWNASSANTCPLSIPAQNELSASRSAAFEHHHMPNRSHRSAPFMLGVVLHWSTHWNPGPLMCMQAPDAETGDNPTHCPPHVGRESPRSPTTRDDIAHPPPPDNRHIMHSRTAMVPTKKVPLSGSMGGWATERESILWRPKRVQPGGDAAPPTTRLFGCHADVPW